MLADVRKLREDLDKVTGGGGKKVLIQLFFTYYLFCKAMARDWVLGTAIPFYQFILGENDATANNMYTAARSPFGIKTLWGSLSDAVACLGYHKRYYILFAVAVSITSIVGLIIQGEIYMGTPGYAGIGATQIATLFIFFFEYGGATVDSLTQARYTELMKMMGTPTIVSFVWFLINSCTLVSAWGNLLLREGSWTILLYFAIPAAIPMLVPATLNWIADPPAKSCCAVETEKVTKHIGIFAMSMVLAFGALGGTAIIIIAPDARNLRMAYYITLSVIFCVMLFNSLPGNIAKPAFYMFLCSTLRLFFNTSLQAWYVGNNLNTGAQLCAQQTDLPCTEDIIATNFSCIDDGPNFDTSYYQFVGNFMGAIAATVAVIIFEKFIVHWNVRAAFWVTTVFQMFSTMLEITLLERWNHTVIFGTDPLDPNAGYVDQLFFLFGPQAVDKIIEMLDFMPNNVLIGKLCPPSMEATIFAVLAGSQNFGTNLAYIFGSIVVEGFGVNFALKTDLSYTCVNPRISMFGVDGLPTLTGLSWARFLGGVVLPAFTVPLTFVLLPNKPLTDDFLDEEQAAPMAAEGGVDLTVNQDSVVMGSMPRNLKTVSTSSFVSMGGISKGLPGGRGDITM